MQLRTSIGLAVGAAVALVLPRGAAAQHQEHLSTDPVKAIAVVSPTAGNTAHGTVMLERVADGVRITARLEGLPAGDHGFHIHEYGDCSAADGTSAGGHFNPAGAPHASPEAAARHVGDLGNVTADTQGMASYSRTDGFVRLDGPTSVIGRAVIVHAGSDDQSTQPTGNAGARLACGVIGVAR